jgi:uncharacterized Zn finger protein (UPF0148 family)
MIECVTCGTPVVLEDGVRGDGCACPICGCMDVRVSAPAEPVLA